jgi:hypothetical protein
MSIKKILTICILATTLLISSRVNAINNPSVYRINTLNEVINNHNNLETDRINLVFKTTGYDEIKAKKVLEILPRLMGWNEKEVLNYNGKPLVSYGFFNTDPIRDYKDKFNFWYMNLELKAEVLTDKNITKSITSKNNILINLTETVEGSASWKDGGIYKGFIYSTLNLNIIENFLSYRNTLTHELGHALFGFWDEYTFDENNTFNNTQIIENEEFKKNLYKDSKSYPNCSFTLDDAKAKWGIYEGQIDSIINEYKNDFKNLGLNVNIDENNYKVGYYNMEYCNNASSQFFRELKDKMYKPTQTSIMHGASDTPLFYIQSWGVVQKEYIKKTLDKVKGTGTNIPYINKQFTKEDLAVVEKEIESNKIYENRYFEFRESLYKRIKLDRPPILYAHFTNGFSYNDYQNSYILYIIDFIFLLIILIAFILIFKLIKYLKKIFQK